MIETKNHLLSGRIRTMSESATIKMAQKARDLSAQGRDVISLSLGEPDFDTPEHIKAAAVQALKDGYTKYTPVPGLVEYREAICTKFKRDNNLHFKPAEIMVSNGAKQCIANICMALLNPGDDAVVLTPYWVSYFEIVRFAGGNPIALSAGIDTEFKISPDQLDEVLTDQTKLIIFSSPSNPTGSVYTERELRQLAAVIARYPNLIVVSDEIYEYINFLDTHFSIGSIPEISDRVITVNGMSKGFAMTGWRLGYMGGPEWIARACAKVQGQVTSGASAFGQKAAAYALLSDLSPTHAMRDAFMKRRDLVKQLLQDIPGIKVNNPQGAFYFFPDISEYFGKSNGQRFIDNADEFVDVLLDEANVAVVSGTAFGDDTTFRLSYAASEDQLVEALNRMKEVLGKYV